MEYNNHYGHYLPCLFILWMFEIIMTSYWKIVNDVIVKADLLLIVLDARFVESTRNKEVESKVASAGKPIIYVITKCDLVDKETLEGSKKKLSPCVFV